MNATTQENPAYHAQLPKCAEMARAAQHPTSSPQPSTAPLLVTQLVQPPEKPKPNTSHNYATPKPQGLWRNTTVDALTDSFFSFIHGTPGVASALARLGKASTAREMYEGWRELAGLGLLGTQVGAALGFKGAVWDSPCCVCSGWTWAGLGLLCTQVDSAFGFKGAVWILPCCVSAGGSWRGWGCLARRRTGAEEQHDQGLPLLPRASGVDGPNLWGVACVGDDIKGVG